MLVFILLGSTNSVLYAQDKPVLSDSLFETFSNHYSADFFKEKYHNYTLEHFIDNYYPNGHYQIETTGNFSQPDQYTFSLTGYSYKWNKFYYDGIRINDLSFPGASLHKPMLFDKDLDIDIVDSRIDFTNNNKKEKYIYGQLNQGSLGDMVPWTDAYTHLMHGHSSGPEKAWQPIPYRRKTRNAGTVYFSLPTEKHNSYGYITAGRRMITNFNHIRIDDYFGEDYLQMHFHGDINLDNRKLDYLITYNSRDNLYSEYYFDKDETSSLNSFNLSAFTRNWIWGSAENGLFSNIGLNYSFKNVGKNNTNLSRNVIDQDGESLEPFYPGGKYHDIILSSNGRKKLSDRLSFVYDNYNGIVKFSPENESYQNTLFFRNNITPFHSLNVTEWNSSAFSTGMLENTFGIDYKIQSAGFLLNAKGNLTYDGILFNPKSITALNYELGFKVQKQLGRKLTSYFEFGKRRVPFEFDQVRFLSNKYQSGQTYFWNDTNNDQNYSASEKGDLFTTTGGAYRSASDELKQPDIYYLDYGNKWKMGKRWELTFLAQYRKFANQWTVQYDRNAETIGQFMPNGDGENIYYLDDGQTINYNVVPFDQQLFERLAEKKLGWLFNSPFYGGLTLNLEKKTPKTYFYVSATAYEVVGLSPMGNGVLTNNLGVLSESQANPNTYIENLGRLDPDRAYIVRIYYHQEIGKRWKFAFQVKYKDGQPVNRNVFDLNTNASGNQFAFWNDDIKGINPFTGQFGVREGGFWNYELKFQYDTRLFDHRAVIDLNIYNIMDVATPLNNYNFPEPDAQYALEFQIPRGALLSVRYKI
ncbi:MAG: hypothetical protein JXQ96_10760 [Cyclobacteriaceae bacterium]